MLNPFDDQPGRDRAKIGSLGLLLGLINLATWIWAVVMFNGRPAVLGTALLAYMLGLRHAFDGDHIAAIDNVVRKLRQEGKSPLSAGFFFSMGHSTVVVLVSVAVVATSTALRGMLAHLGNIFDVVGTIVSASFLLMIGIVNLIVLAGAWMARAALESRVPRTPENLAGLGLLSRFFHPLFGIVTGSLQMYLIGFLFGLGFDTATEIGLLGIAATQAAQSVPLWNILVFPALFAAGMSLMDTADSVLMTRAYGWAFITPERKRWYNLTITMASVCVAFVIGGVEVLELIRTEMGFAGRFWRIVESLNESVSGLGIAVVGMFLVIWVASMAASRLKRSEAAIGVRS